MTDFEGRNFHFHNATPNQRFSAFFETDSFVLASEIFNSLKKVGLRSKHIHCLQKRRTGEIFLTFCMTELCNMFLSKRFLWFGSVTAIPFFVEKLC